jgi:hypothetical protein
MTDANEEEIAARREMRAAFMLGTDEGLMAFLWGLVDTLLMGDTLQPNSQATGSCIRHHSRRERATVFACRLAEW